MRITITSQGWIVSEADTAEAARDRVRDTRPDLVLLDITFGDSGPDGLAVCAELKADPATASVPIVILTAHDDPAERERAIASGADAFVTKPFGPLDLMRLVRDLIPAHASTPALGVYLLDAGVVEPTTLERALDEQRELIGKGTPKRLGDVLLARGLVSAPALDRALLEQAHARAVHAEAGRTRVLVIDDHVAVREGLKALIQSDAALYVVGEAADVDEGLRVARRHHPDVVVLDNEMPGRSGLDLIPQLRSELPSTKIVMFSLDGAVRERAIAAGAHTFITKDAPMVEILDALRPRQATPPSAEGSAYVPPLVRERGFRRAAAVIAASLAAYVVLFFALEPGFGAAAGAFSVVPVVAVGALAGSGAGLIAAAITLVLTGVLWTVSGHAVGEPVLEVGGRAAGIVLLLLLGFGVGALRELRYRLDPRRARVEAILDAARALAGLERGELARVFLESLLRIVPAEVALLYSNAAGDARFVAASRGLSNASTDRLADLARDTMRTATARTVDELAAADRPVPGARSAALMPVSVAGLDVRGALVLIGAHRFSDADLARIRPFANYLWLVLRTGAGHPGAEGYTDA